MAKLNQPPQEVLEQLKRASTAYVWDAMENLGLGGATAGLRPITPFGETHVAGPAFTIKYLPIRGTKKSPYNVYALMRTLSPGDVVVMEGHGIERYFLGENVVTGCMQAGGQSIVIDGGARDFLEIQGLDFPLFCRFPAILPRHSAVEVVDVNVPVICAGAQVWPGDIVVGDNDGVVFIPLEALDDVLKMLTVITECEHEQRRIIKGNLPIEKMAEVSARKRSGRSVLG